jgi:hypothetical protein
MSRTYSYGRNQVGQFASWGLAVVLAVAGLSLPASAAAQSKKKSSNEPEKKTGTIAEVEKKGKTALLWVAEADGEKFKVQVTTKMKFVVHGTGDSDFFKHPRAFVSSDSVFTANQKYFGKKFTIHLGNTPPAQFEADEDKPEVFHVAGPIVDCDETSFTINAGGDLCKINFEQGAELTVAIVSSEPEHATVGAPVEVEGTTKGGMFHPTAVVVTLDKPLVADEVFAASDNKKTAKGKSAAGKAAKKPAKTDKGEKEEMADTADDAPPKDPFKSGGSDPFGVAKKDPKKKSTPAPTKPKPKKPAETDADN